MPPRKHAPRRNAGFEKPVLEGIYPLLVLLGILLACPLYSQPLGTERDTSEAAPRRVILDHANEIRGAILKEQGENGLISESVRILIGDVRLRDSTTRVRCDTAIEYQRTKKVRLASKKGNRATIIRDTVTLRGIEGFYYPDEALAVMRGNVTLVDPTLSLRSQEGSYFTEEQIAIFSKGVVLKDSLNTIFTDSLTFYRPESHAVAIGRFRLLNTADNIELQGQIADHYLKKKRSIIRGAPMLIKLDSLRENGKNTLDTLIIRSVIMRSFRGEEDAIKRVEMQDSVRIQRGRLAALTGNAVYYYDSLTITLTQNPIVWYEASQLTGDSIIITLKEKKRDESDHMSSKVKREDPPPRKETRLETIRIFGSAFLVSRDTLDPERKKFNQVSGVHMILFFDEASQLRRAEVYREAQSLYYTYSDSIPKGANLTSGDVLIMEFSDNAASRIVVKGDVEGAQYPERLLSKLKNLDGFVWREDERPRLTIGKETTAVSGRKQEARPKSAPPAIRVPKEPPSSRLD